MLFAAASASAQDTPVELDPKVAELRDAALESDFGYKLVESLTTELGPRLAGTDAEARARDWGVAKFKELGFENVRIEEFDIPVWIRGEEKAEIVSPYPQNLILTALGNSGATPREGITADVVYFEDFEALSKAEPDDLKGKIAFVMHQMTRAQDGSGYGKYGLLRRRGPDIAAQKGAAAIIIKSIGTDRGRGPHTGGTNFSDGVDPIPSAALSTSDARNLERIMKLAKERDQSVQIKLTLTPRFLGIRKSGNVIGEIPGSDPDAGIIVVGGHLDSWDLGTGAIDDGAGCAITAAAAKHVMDAGQPRRTIRVVWFGAEEIGLYGGKAYFEAHKDDPHVLAAESDFGARRIWRFRATLPEAASAVKDRLAKALDPLGIMPHDAPAGGGPDVGYLVDAGTPAVDLNQDGTDYFDFHHTPEDTLERIDPEQMAQNVAAWTAMLAVVANAPEDLTPDAKPDEPAEDE